MSNDHRANLLDLIWLCVRSAPTDPVGVRKFSLVNCRGSGFGYLVVLGA
jgi:hypothetical protein